MGERRYYSDRMGKRNDLDFKALKEVTKAIYLDYYHKNYFDRNIFSDSGNPPLIGDIESYFTMKLHKPNLWPIETRIKSYSEEDLFDIVELLNDLVSKPLKINNPSAFGPYLSYSDEKGKTEFQEDINNILKDYRDGYELSKDGEILSIADLGFEDLVNEELPVHDPENIDNKIKNAVSKFRRHHSSIDDKKDAIRILEDVLEFLKPEINKLQLSKDTDALFNIANNFSIRHHNRAQHADYDKPIWFTWMFYTHLATIHVIIKLANETAA